MWRMDVSDENAKKNDVLEFAKANEEKYVNLVENEIEQMNSVKVCFGLTVDFSDQRNRHDDDDDEVEHTEHYFREQEPHVFTRNNREFIRHAIRNFFETIDAQMGEWAENGSGMVVEKVSGVYINIAHFQPLRPVSYLDLPKN